MRDYNNGIGDDNILHNQFTAYLITALRNRKIRYLQHNNKLQIIEVSLDALDLFSDKLPDDGLLTGLPVLEMIEDFRLHESLKKVKERELKILFARALYGKSFPEIALDLGMKTNTVASIYFRLIKRLKRELRGDEG